MLLDTLKADEDRFTFILPKEKEGVLLGRPVDFGFSTRYLRDTLYVSYVYRGSPADRAGLRRGDWIARINARTYTPRPPVLPPNPSAGSLITVEAYKDGMFYRADLAKALYEQRGVSTHRILKTESGHKVGYFHLSSFQLPSYADELRTLFSVFKQEGIRELVVDLRYNRGGYETVAAVLGSLVLEGSAGKVFATHLFNEHLQGIFGTRARATLFQKEAYALSLSRCFFLVDQGTASASELLIHALRPYIPVFLVGKQTLGKNVGSYRLQLPLDYEAKTHVFHPIVFEIFNADGVSYASMPPDYPAADGVSRPLGDVGETMLSSVLHYITHGAFPGHAARRWGADGKQTVRAFVGGETTRSFDFTLMESLTKRSKTSVSPRGGGGKSLPIFGLICRPISRALSVIVSIKSGEEMNVLFCPRVGRAR